MGYAHIDFSLPSEAAAAVTLDGKYLQDRFLNVAFAKPKKLQKGS